MFKDNAKLTRRRKTTRAAMWVTIAAVIVAVVLWSFLGGGDVPASEYGG